MVQKSIVYACIQVLTTSHFKIVLDGHILLLHHHHLSRFHSHLESNTRKLQFTETLQNDSTDPCICRLHLTKVPASTTAASTTTKVVLHWPKVGGLGVVVAHVIVVIAASAATTATVAYDGIICKLVNNKYCVPMMWLWGNKTLTITIAVITISSISPTAASTSTLVVTLVIPPVAAIVIATRTARTTSITYNIHIL